MSEESTQVPSKRPEPTDDKRLERLFDYTKWHIGIYLSIGGGLVGLLASSEHEFVHGLILHPHVFIAAILAMALAGVAGGMIASATTRARSFNAVWNVRLRLHCCRTFKGRVWASIEHYAFWVSLALFSYSVLAGRSFERAKSAPEPKPCCCQCVAPLGAAGAAP